MTAGRWLGTNEQPETLTAASLISEWNTAILGLPTHEQRTKAYEDAVLSLAVFLACDEGTPEAAQSILAAAVAAVQS
jgi:hypothetical protein